MNTSRYASSKTLTSFALLMLACLIVGEGDTVAGQQRNAGQQPDNVQTAISYEGQKVGSVEVAGQPDLNRHSVANLISQPINAPYHQQQVDATVDALKKSGKYDDVKVLVTPEADGLRLLFLNGRAIRAAAKARAKARPFRFLPRGEKSDVLFPWQA